MPSQKPTIISIGDLVVDLIAPARLPILAGQHQETRGFRLEPGGGATFNIMAARLGLNVQALGAVGDDQFGHQLVSWLRAEGVGVENVWQAPGSTSTVVLDLIDAAAGEHVFVASHGKGELAPWKQNTKSFYYSDAIFLQGYTLLEDQNVALVDAANYFSSSNNVPVFFDVGPSAAHVDKICLRNTLSSANFVFATEDELPFVAEGRTASDAETFLFKDSFTSHVIVKMGAAGCRVVTGDGVQHFPGFAVEVVDTVGAGDCFDAGFIYGHTHGWPLEETARLANACGAAACRKQGAGRNAPTRAEVAALFGRDNF